MNIWKWLWEKICSIFISFVKSAVDQLSQKLIVELKDFGLSVVTALENTDLTSEEKRLEAFEQIKAEAIRRGLAFRDSSINLLIELCVSQLKQLEV